MAPTTPADRQTFIGLARLPAAGRITHKSRFHKLGERVLRDLAEVLGLELHEYVLTHNYGGMNQAGEIIMYTDTLFVSFGQYADRQKFWWRHTAGPDDLNGGPTRWEVWEVLKDLKAFAKRIQPVGSRR